MYERMKDFNVLLGKGGLYGSNFRIAPPLCVNKDDIDYFLDVLETVLEE